MSGIEAVQITPIQCVQVGFFCQRGQHSCGLWNKTVPESGPDAVWWSVTGGLRGFDRPSSRCALQRVLLKLYSGDTLGGLFLSPPKKSGSGPVTLNDAPAEVADMSIHMSAENTEGIRIRFCK